jgi:hypothetical protein
MQKLRSGRSRQCQTTSVNNGLQLFIDDTRLIHGVPRGTIAIDELELFNRVLTQAEIQSIVSAGQPESARDLKDLDCACWLPQRVRLPRFTATTRKLNHRARV